MTGTSVQASTLPDGAGPPRPARFRRLRWLLAVMLLAAVAFAAAALLPGSHASAPPRFSVRQTAHGTDSKNTLPEHISKVLGASNSAKLYGKIDALRENQGENLKGQFTSDLTPLPASVFRQPIARYRRYAEQWATRFGAAVSTLQASLAAGNRTRAEQAWDGAFFDFMHLGADYNLLPTTLTDRIAEVPSSLGDKRFPGLHRIEEGLWTGQQMRTLLRVAAGVARAARELQRMLPTVPIGTLDYTLRIHEILEDAQRDLLSGTAVPWSGAGVLGTEARVVATRELLATVKPVLEARDNSYGESEDWLEQLQHVLLSVRRPDGGWPTVRQLTTGQHERINADMDGALGALEQVPGALETREITGFPSIPKQRGHAR